jgi:UDP:flavonoid glycosyltransferase YjiC (YdhE family)
MPPQLGHLNRHYNLAKYLTAIGHKVTVLVGSKLHNTTINYNIENKYYSKYPNIDFDFIFVKTIDYKESKVKRLISMFQFYFNSMKYLRKTKKFDIILGSSGHQLNALFAIKYAKKNKIKSIVEIRDLWPESLVTYGVAKKSSMLIRFMYFIENWMYKRADSLIFTMEGGVDYIRKSEKLSKNVAISKIFHLNNGIDLSYYDECKIKFMYDDPILDTQSFKVVYVGSVRLANRVDILLDVAQKMQNKDIQFLVYGTGDKLEELVAKANELKITNLHFRGFIEKKFIPSILERASLNIILGDNHNLFSYGLSLNKLFDYAASGKPILSTYQMGYSLIRKYNAGSEINDNTVENIVKEIDSFKNMNKSNYNAICENSRLLALDYDYKNLANQLNKIIESTIRRS